MLNLSPTDTSEVTDYIVPACGCFSGRFLKLSFSKEHKNRKRLKHCAEEVGFNRDHREPEWRGNGVPGDNASWQQP